MKLIRHGDPGKEKPGVLLNDGTRLDVSAFEFDYDEAFFDRRGLAALQHWLKSNASTAPRVPSTARLGPPISRPSKIVCIGLNFRDHAAESKMEIPKSQSSFSRRLRRW